MTPQLRNGGIGDDRLRGQAALSGISSGVDSGGGHFTLVAPPTPILTESGGRRPGPDAQFRRLSVERWGLSVIL